MQTAVGVFGGEEYTEETNAPPLMKEKVGHSERAAISSLNCPPFIAVELCREHLVCEVNDLNASSAYLFCLLCFFRV